MEQRTADISKIQYGVLRKNPVFFLKFHENIWEDYHGEEHDDSTWRSVDRDLSIIIKAEKFANRYLDYALCIIDKAVPKTDEEGKEVSSDLLEMSFHAVDTNNVNDWIYIINSFVIRSQNHEDKYAFTELLWALCKLHFNGQVFIAALSKYPEQTVPFLLSNLQKIGRCLSYNKQVALQSVCSAYHYEYKIYSPEIFKQAFACVEYDKLDFKNLNLFSIVDAVFGKELNGDNLKGVQENPLLLLRHWIETPKSPGKYDLLINTIPLVNEDLRLAFVKRYFHDIRNGQTNFDIHILEKVKDNKFDDFTRYRYCIESPTETIVLPVPLLCDNLITLYNSKGATFQSFDGVLDFAMTRCDTTHPAVDFQIDRFIPTCNHGAVYNRGTFKGFIDYSLVRKLDEKLLSEEHLTAVIVHLLDKHGRRQTYAVCKYGDGTKISDDVFLQCNKERIRKGNSGGQVAYHFDCYTYKLYDDRWTVPSDQIPAVNKFMKEPLPESSDNKEVTVTLDMTSSTLLKQYIETLPDKYQALEEEEFVVPSYDKNSLSKDDDLYLIQEFSQILRMRLFPQKGALVGTNFDVFGYWAEIRKNLSTSALANRTSEEFKNAHQQYVKKEIDEVHRRTISSLKRELNKEPDSDGCFELPYDRHILSKMIQRFYFSSSYSENDELDKHEFLRSEYFSGKFKPFCAPTLADEPNPAISLPFFWCRGKECFHNNLGNQTLEDEKDWRQYTLFHMAEIIGYPKLHKTEGGYEPDNVVRQFIAITNKVMQKFKRLKCRSCGHLLFTDKSSGFNRYNYYACANPVCPEVAKPIYLNFCFHCKKGLIDSRDSKRCPNGWYICPSCLSCCDDAQYERLAQRYIVSNRPVPLRIESKRGQGHNDKGLYFCPKCGGEIEKVDDGHGRLMTVCKNCHTDYSTDPYEYN
jgi:hypothetical protein